jgi:protein-disulfide isomerase
MKHNKIFFFASGVLLWAAPLLIHADYGYFTMPIAASDTNSPIISWFDHTSPLEGDDTSTVLTRYDGVVFTTSTGAVPCDKNIGNCYSGHSGIDFSTKGVEGKDILAAASGTVRQVQWQDPNNTSNSMNFGFFVRLWHPQYGLSTLYGHANATSSAGIVNVSDTVARAQKIAVSGQTGCYNYHLTSTLQCPHLHFQVYNADDTVTSSPPTSGFHWADSVDPYGWSPGGPGSSYSSTSSDPWPNEAPFGYMWASKAATSSYITTSTGLMTASTTWLADQIYVIQSSLTVSSTATLTIKQGAVVKFDSTGAYLQVDGKLDVQGTSSDPVYFTSIKDDTVGGDVNDDATTTTPSLGDWGYIQLGNKSTSTIKNAVIRYGGHNVGNSFADIYVNGGYLSATSTVIASSTFYGLQVASGTVKVTTSTFSGNGYYGLFVPWNGIGNITVTTSSFADNGGGTAGNGAANIDFTSGVNVTSTGSTSTRNVLNGFIINGNPMTTNLTLGDTIPYIIASAVTVSSTKTLTINPGVITKLDSSQSALIVDGTLNVKGTTSTNPIYFTSTKDDSVGGDTNGDGTATSPAPGDWKTIQLDGGSSSTLNYAIVRYGGPFVFLSNADIYMGGGKLTVWHSTIASSSNYGIQVVSGTVTVASSTLQNDGTTTTLSIFNSTNMTSSVTAKQNYWNATSGPYNATGHSTGTGDGVDDHVNFIPWLTSTPL